MSRPAPVTRLPGPPRRRRYRLRRPWRLVGVVLAVALVGGCTWWGLHGFPLLVTAPSAGPAVGAGAAPDPGQEPQATPAPPVASDGPIWVLLLGVDSRADDQGRSDTMILARLDDEQQTVHLLSLPRDTLAPLPDHPEAKLNEAYAYGGTSRALQAVSSVVGVEVPYYVQIDLNGFRKVVDLLGGVHVNVDRRMLYHDPYQDLVIDLMPGEQWLSGEQALKFVRFRLSDDGDHDDDLVRAQRQQRFLRALAAQALTPANWPKAPRVLAEVVRHVRTNLPADSHLALAQLLYQSRAQIYGVTLPGTVEHEEGGGWYFTPDRKQLDLILASWGGLPLPPEEDAGTTGE